jgi:hypothetical protein
MLALCTVEPLEHKELLLRRQRVEVGSCTFINVVFLEHSRLDKQRHRFFRGGWHMRCIPCLQSALITWSRCVKMGLHFANNASQEKSKKSMEELKKLPLAFHLLMNECLLEANEGLHLGVVWQGLELGLRLAIDVIIADKPFAYEEAKCLL